MSVDQVQGAFITTTEAVYKYKTQQPMIGTIGDPLIKQTVSVYQHNLEVYGSPYKLHISDAASQLNMTG